MKTIKQIANEQGKSKEAVRQKIRKLGLQPELAKSGNQILIDELQERLIIQEFLKSRNSNANQTQTSLHENTQIALRFAERENEFLRAENTRLQEQNNQLTAALIATTQKKGFFRRLLSKGE